MRNLCIASILMTLSALVSLPVLGQESSETSEPKALKKGGGKPSEKPGEGGWKPLLPKTGLDGWKVTDFGSEGKIEHDGELLIVEMGDPLNGITYTKQDFPNDNFEIRLEAKRVEGNDFLCGLTFPVGGNDQFCSLIAGGWGGSIVGLSSVDGVDASENATTTYEEFENGKWYRFRVRVDPEMITVFINDKRLFYQEREGHEFSTRIEVWGSQPLGFCTFQSLVHVRNFEWRPITSTEKGSQKPKAAGALGETVK